MNQKFNANNLTGLRKPAPLKGKGHRKRKDPLGEKPQPNGPSAGRALAHRGRDSLQRIATADLEKFLSTPAVKDAEVSQVILAEIKKTGLQDLDLGTLQDILLTIDPRAIKVLGDLIEGVETCPEIEGSGVSASVMVTDARLRHTMLGMDETLSWSQDRILVGRQVLESYQVDANSAVVCALLLALAAASTEDDFLALVRDAVEVLRLEEADLQKLVDTRKHNAKTLDGLGAEAASIDEAVQFLQTMQDIRDEKRPPRAVLEQMAHYYATRYDESGNEQPPPDTGPGRQRQRTLH